MGKSIKELEKQIATMREAIKEAILFLKASDDSPRHWPVARANLYAKLGRAYRGEPDNE